MNTGKAHDPFDDFNVAPAAKPPGPPARPAAMSPGSDVVTAPARPTRTPRPRTATAPPPVGDERSARLQIRTSPRIEALILAEIAHRLREGRRGRGVADKTSAVEDAIERAYGHLLKQDGE